MNRLVALSLLVLLCQFSSAAIIDRSTPEQRAFRESMAKSVDKFVAEAFENIEKSPSKADAPLDLFREEVEALTKRGFKRGPHYSVYIGNPSWHDGEPNLDTPMYLDLQSIYENSPLRAADTPLLPILPGREGKLVVKVSVRKGIDGGWTYFYEGEARLTIRYLRSYQNNGDVLLLQPTLVETSFRWGTSLEGNGSSAGGPR